MGNPLHLAHDAQRVAAENFQDALIGIAARHQAAHQARNPGNIFHAFGKLAGSAVKVGSQAHVIDSGYLDRVIDVIEQTAERDATELSGAPGSIWRAAGPRRERSPNFGACASAASCSACSSLRAANRWAKSESRKPSKKLMCTTPPFLASARSISSVMLRGTSSMARQDECEAITGAADVSSAS